jgi:hypothetical protein
MAEIPEGGIWLILDGLRNTTTTSLLSLFPIPLDRAE